MSHELRNAKMQLIAFIYPLNCFIPLDYLNKNGIKRANQGEFK
jgi:hypothetical protein